MTSPDSAGVAQQGTQAGMAGLVFGGVGPRRSNAGDERSAANSAAAAAAVGARLRLKVVLVWPGASASESGNLALDGILGQAWSASAI